MAGKTQQGAFVQAITPMDENFSRWYTDVVVRAELMDYSEVKGCMVIRPYGYGIWELIQHEMDQRFKATGHKNAYFPMFIPESLLKKEAEHTGSALDDSFVSLYFPVEIPGQTQECREESSGAAAFRLLESRLVSRLRKKLCL